MTITPPWLIAQWAPTLWELIRHDRVIALEVSQLLTEQADFVFNEAARLMRAEKRAAKASALKSLATAVKKRARKASK